MRKALTLSIFLIFQHFLILFQFSRKMCPAIPFALEDQHPVFLQLLNPEKKNSYEHINDLSIKIYVKCLKLDTDLLITEL